MTDDRRTIRPLVLLGRFALAAGLLLRGSEPELPEGNLLPVSAFGQELELLRVDRLSRVFGYVFFIASLLFSPSS